jgi:trans-aconitate methyltransferase
MNETDNTQRLRSTASYNAASDSADIAIRLMDRWWIDEFLRGPATLELGCGDGTSTRLLLDKGLHVDVVEKEPAFCRMVAESPGRDRLRVHQAAFETFEPPRSYDDVVLARSLDQIADPLTLLARIRNWLAPGGRLHVVVQNAESLHRRIGKALGMLPALTYLSPASIASGHQRVYTKAALVDELQKAGYQVRVCRGFLLKPFDYDSLSRLDVPLVSRLLPALYEVGREMPDELCCQLYALCGTA